MLIFFANSGIVWDRSAVRMLTPSLPAVSKVFGFCTPVSQTGSSACTGRGNILTSTDWPTPFTRLNASPRQKPPHLFHGFNHLLVAPRIVFRRKHEIIRNPARSKRDSDTT